MKIKYWAHPSTGLSDKDAERLGKAITKLRNDLGRKVEREDFVAAAKPKSSPIHDYFEWDDEMAGVMHRKHQASNYLANIKIYKVNGDSSEPTRAFVNIKDVDPDTKMVTRGYVTAQEALDNKNYRRQVVERWQKRLTRIREEIRVFEEFADVVVELEKLD